MAGAEKDTNKALDGDRLGQVQFDELVALRKETYRHFHADIEQFIAWYTVPRDVSLIPGGFGICLVAQTLEGPFSTVSKPIFSTKASF